MRTSKHAGFTILEIVIVIVVIGILATLTIVSYSAVTKNARKQGVTADAQGMASALTRYRADNGRYPASLDLVTSKPATQSSFQYSYNATTDVYCLTSSTSGISVYIQSGNSTVIDGGCPGHGVNGNSPITNYALDPNASGSSPSTAFGFAGGSVASSIRTIASDRAHNGSTSLKTEVTGTGQIGTEARVPYHGVRVNAGEKLAWSFWIYSTKAGTISPWIDATKVVDNSYTGGGSAPVAVAANTWVKVTGVYTAVIDMYPTQVGAYGLPVVAGDIIWTDEFMVTKAGTVQNYADGDSANWIWNGAAHNSSSTGPAL